MSRIPEPDSEFDAEGIPDLGSPLPGKEITGDAQEGIMVPRDRPIAAEEFGTTAYEEEHGEDLDHRLAREEPDVLTEEAIARPDRGDDPGPVGRLVQDDEGAGPDLTAEEVGHSVGTDRGGQSAEESAMHLVDENEA
jgi:hypothetical protein